MRFSVTFGHKLKLKSWIGPNDHPRGTRFTEYSALNKLSHSIRIPRLETYDAFRYQSALGRWVGRKIGSSRSCRCPEQRPLRHVSLRVSEDRRVRLVAPGPCNRDTTRQIITSSRTCALKLIADKLIATTRNSLGPFCFEALVALATLGDVWC